MLGVILSLSVCSVCHEFLINPLAKDTQLKEILGVGFVVLLGVAEFTTHLRFLQPSAPVYVVVSLLEREKQQQAEDISNCLAIAFHLGSSFQGHKTARAVTKHDGTECLAHLAYNFGAFLRAICHTSFECAIVVFASAH